MSEKNAFFFFSENKNTHLCHNYYIFSLKTSKVHILTASFTTLGTKNLKGLIYSYMDNNSKLLRVLHHELFTSSY